MTQDDVEFDEVSSETTQSTTQAVPEMVEELAPSQEAQHLVDALDNMLVQPESTSIDSTNELDEFINPQAIELDDSELTQSMAEFR